MPIRPAFAVLYDDELGEAYEIADGKKFFKEPKDIRIKVYQDTFRLLKSAILSIGGSLPKELSYSNEFICKPYKNTIPIPKTIPNPKQ